MKRTIKGFVLGVIMTTMVMSTVFGAQVKKTIDVIYNSVNVTLNGAKVDTDNFLYEGTTYLPLRAISEMLGKEVGWDQKTKTASIYDKEVEMGNSKVESLVGYMVIKDNVLYFDEVEIVKSEDKERMKELGIDEGEMVSWYMIINEKNENNTYELADKVNYTFTDVYLNFIKESEDDKLYHTTKKEEFLKHLAEYDLNDIPLSEQTIPYFIEVQDGKIISITEEFKFTI